MLSLRQANGDRVLAALSRSLAIIEFDPSGRILDANPNFCAALGYSLDEIKGKRHSLFVDHAYAESVEYRQFWDKLARGEFDAREYRRIGKNGREVWIQASYNPVRDGAGRVVKVVKVATDITQAKLRNAEFEGLVNAISRAQAVIEFSPGGEILTANDNFLKAMGYSLNEIVGRKHSLFVDPAYAASSDYRDFWARLNAGEFVAAEFLRIGKGGKEVHIQASYNPIFDLNGKVAKVVKFATDVTGRVKSCEALARGLEALAHNNLRYRINEPFEPTFESLKRDFNRSLEILDGSMGQVVINTSGIHTAVAEVAQASSDLARRTEQQAASLEETAAALDEITATVARSAEGAREASRAASAAKTDAERSGAVMAGAMRAMSEIEQSSSRITHIISVIDEIAFQTNLLALNAGVEAARAGEAGRGFAVVASEVRALAQRSAEAAKEIKGLIDTSSNQVGEGVKLVNDTSDVLTTIADKVAQIDTLIADIAASAQEQSSGLAQVNSSVNHMDQVTQQNAAMVEETTAAAVNLKSEADALSSLVSAFSISSGGALGAAPPRPAVRMAPRAARLATGAAPALKAEADWAEF